MLRQFPHFAGFVLGLVAALDAGASSGQEAKPPKPAAVDFKTLDRDGDGILTLEEWLVDVPDADRPAQRWKFYYWDADNNQQLNAEEFKQQGKGVVPGLTNRYRARDADGDGRMSRKEYVRPNVGTKWEQAAKIEAEQSDVDGDGFLTLLEFSFAPQEQFYGEELFPLMDADGNSFVDRAEFVRPFPYPRWPEAGARFCRSDSNADGRLDRDEFIHQGQGDRLRPDAVVEAGEKVLREIEPICTAADGDRDGRLTEREWPQEQIGKIIAEFAEIPFREWDRDGNGGVTANERRLLVEIAWGVRRLDGQPLRKPGGYVLVWATIRQLDKDQDDVLSRDEFIAGFWEGAKNAERFQEWDKDGDSRLTFAELAAVPSLYFDAYWEFSRLDEDADGSITSDELRSKAQPWQKAMAPRLAAAFDVNSDESLDPDEFLLTPFANPVADWYVSRPDSDNDGRLSWTEFYTERTPLFYALSRNIFRRFDRDGDGFLSQLEFDFTVDPAQRSLAAKLAAFDSDGDGRVSREEYVRPNIGSKWEQAARDESVRFDVDGDGFLSVLEFAFTPHGRFPAPELFPLLDTDGDGFLNRAEFLKPRPREQWPPYGTIFYRSDSDGDGRLNLAEFMQQGNTERLRPDALTARVEKLLLDIGPLCAAANGNGSPTAREWPQTKIDQVAGDLQGIPFREWDRDGDGTVTESERRSLVEIAFGVRRIDGQLLRKPAGYVMGWAYFRALDKNKDDVISREEFIAGHHEGAKNAERFQEWDKDGDGRLVFAELSALPSTFADVYREFCNFDADIDGRVTRDEFIAKAAPWQKSMASRLVAAFDLNGDGALDLDEYVQCPFANPVYDWHIPRPDTDNDGRISWTEYYAEKSPLFYGLSRSFFRRFDRDGDGFLSRSEFDFPVDLEKVPAVAALAALDANADGRLVLSELVEPDRPKSDDPSVLLRWEEKTMRVEEAFRAGDANRDGALTVEEFGKQQASLTAAILGKAAPSSLMRVKAAANGSPGTSSEESWNWRFLGIVGCNVLLVAGVAWMLLKRS